MDAIDLAAEVADIREELAELQTRIERVVGRPATCREATTCTTGSRPTRASASTATWAPAWGLTAGSRRSRSSSRENPPPGSPRRRSTSGPGRKPGALLRAVACMARRSLIAARGRPVAPWSEGRLA